jgi:hypothetical protein
MMVSEDSGRTWGPDLAVFDTGPITNANLTLLKDGTVLYATHADILIDRRAYERLKRDPRTEKLVEHSDDRTRLDFFRLSNGEERPSGPDPAWNVYTAHAGTYVRRSSDQGHTWSQPYWVSPIDGVPPVLPGMPSPSYIRNPAFVLSDGSLVIPVYTGSKESWTAQLMESPDGGIHWKVRGVIARPEGNLGFNETVIYECMSGKLVAFMRTENGGGYTYTATSKDGGRSWSKPQKEDLWGYPCTVIRMPSGRALVVYGYRRPPFGVRARLLDAECQHIGEAEEFVVRSDGGTRDLGYPLATLLPDGTALVAYYFNSKTDNGNQLYITSSILTEG